MFGLRNELPKEAADACRELCGTLRKLTALLEKAELLVPIWLLSRQGNKGSNLDGFLSALGGAMGTKRESDDRES